MGNSTVKELWFEQSVKPCKAGAGRLSLLPAELSSPPFHIHVCVPRPLVTQASYYAALFAAGMGSAWFLPFAYLTLSPVCTQSPGTTQPHPQHLLFALVVSITLAMKRQLLGVCVAHQTASPMRTITASILYIHISFLLLAQAKHLEHS